MNTPWRCSFHHAVVAMSGARRSTSRASARAARRTSVKSHRGSTRTFTWMPRFPDVFGNPVRPCSQDLVDDERHLPGVVEGSLGRGVDVDAKLVGMVDVAAAHRPRVEVEAS